MSLQPVTCNCKACRAMCADSVCMPTPDDVRALVEAGYGDRLARFDPRGVDGSQGVRFVAPAPRGFEGLTLPSTLGLGACTFYSSAGCELHALGLKPLEGRLARHDRSTAKVRRVVYATWARVGAAKQTEEVA